MLKKPGARKIKQWLVALLAGALFATGLVVSGMTQPAKVIGFLNVAGLVDPARFGAWDPSLAFVMAAAIPVAAVGFAIARRCQAPLCATEFSGPTNSKLDTRLVVGAVLFGIGWGLAGYCPGPALASLGLGGWRVLLFVASMLVGMAAFRIWVPGIRRDYPGDTPLKSGLVR